MLDLQKLDWFSSILFGTVGLVDFAIVGLGIFELLLKFCSLLSYITVGILVFFITNYIIT